MAAAANEHEWASEPTIQSILGRGLRLLAPFSLCGPHLGIKARLGGLSRDTHTTSALVEMGGSVAQKKVQWVYF